MKRKTQGYLRLSMRSSLLRLFIDSCCKGVRAGERLEQWEDFHTPCWSQYSRGEQGKRKYQRILTCQMADSSMRKGVSAAV